MGITVQVWGNVCYAVLSMSPGNVAGGGLSRSGGQVGGGNGATNHPDGVQRRRVRGTAPCSMLQGVVCGMGQW